MSAKRKPAKVDPITVEGFVILQPLSPWEERNAVEIWGCLGPSTFGSTAGEAWARLFPRSGDQGEDAARRQRAMDKGYRLARATMTIQPALVDGGEE